MSGERTEEPTPKRLLEARKRGEVARSADVYHLIAPVALLVGLAASEGPAASFLDWSRRVFSSSSGVSSAGVLGLSLEGLAIAARLSLPALAASVGAAAVLGYGQVGSVFAWQTVMPKLERMSLSAGFKRAFSPNTWLELAKALLKIVLLAALAAVVVAEYMPSALRVPLHAPLVALDLGVLVFREGLRALLWRVAVVAVVAGLLDVLYQRWKWKREHRMTKDEVKREYKESEGDPELKRERERVHRQALEYNLLEEVRRADVLLVNPTHLAVALRYDRADEEGAPLVTAKGDDALARRMREIAEAAGVPIIEDVPLARSLYELDLGDEVPPALYDAVAQVLEIAWATRETDGEQDP